MFFCEINEQEICFKNVLSVQNYNLVKQIPLQEKKDFGTTLYNSKSDINFDTKSLHVHVHVN